MQGLMPSGLENPSPRRHSGKKQAGEQTDVRGHGEMSSSWADVIRESLALETHQRSAFSTQG